MAIATMQKLVWGSTLVVIALSLSCGDGAESSTTTLDASTTGGSGGTASTGAGGSGGAGGNRETTDAASVCIYDDAGRLSPEAKACTTDSDCTFVPTYTCCGPSLIVGLAKNAPAYGSCFATRPPQGCGNLGCASQAQTEDRQDGAFIPLDLKGVSVQCVESDGGPRACMTHYDADAGR